MKLKNSPTVNKPFRSLFNASDIIPKRKSNVESLVQVNIKSQV